MADWKSGNAAPPRPVRRDGAPPAPTRKTTTTGEAAAPAQENPPVAAQPAVQEIPVVAPVAETAPAQKPVVAPQKIAPVVNEQPVPAAKQGPVETRRSSIFAAPGSSPVRSTTGSGTHPAASQQPMIVSALETSTPVQQATPAPVVEPPKAPPVAAPVAPVTPVQAAPVQAAPAQAPQATPAVAEPRRASDTGTKLRNIRNQKMALSLPVVITHPSGKEDTRTVFVLSRGAVVFLSAPVQSGLQVNLKNPNNGKSSDCRVVGIERGPDGVNQVELEFMQPMPGFWPVHFPPEDWNPEDRKRPLPTTTPAKTAAAATAAPAVESKPVVMPSVAQPSVKETKPAAVSIPAIKIPAQPAPVKVTPVTSRPAPVVTPVPVAEPVQHTPSLVASASSTTIERVEREKSVTGSGHHEARTSVTPHITVPSFAHAHAAKKPTGMIVGALGVLVVAGAIGGGWFYFKGDTKVSAGSKQPSTTTSSAPATNSNLSTTANPATATNPIAATGNTTPAATQPDTSNTTANTRTEAPAHETSSSRSSRSSDRNNNNSERTSQQQPQQPSQPAVQQQTPAEIQNNNRSVLANTTTKPADTPVAPQPVLIASNNTAPNLNIPPVRSNVTNVAKPGISKGAQLTHRVTPVYPAAAMSARITGNVILTVQIDANGNVSGVKAKGNPMLQQAAINAVKQWKYSPAIKDDKPVPSTEEVTLIFSPGR